MSVHLLWLSVRQLLPDKCVHFILDARGLLGIVECEEAKNGVKLADLRDTQVLQVVQHTLCVCVCACVHVW